MQQLLDDCDNYVLKVDQVAAELNQSADGALSARFKLADFAADYCMAPVRGVSISRAKWRSSPAI
jgi:hypothetical protein